MTARRFTRPHCGAKRKRKPPRQAAVSPITLKLKTAGRYAAVMLVPMALLETPAIAAVHPTMADPLVARALTNVMPAHPHVMAAVPAPVARRPDVSGTWRRHVLHAVRWRGDLDIDIGPLRLHRARDSGSTDDQHGADERFAN